MANTKLQSPRRFTWRGACLAACLLAGGCASADPHATRARASLSTPSVDESLPAGSQLHLALAEAETGVDSEGGGVGLGLVVLTADRRIWAHLSLRPRDEAHRRVRVEFWDPNDEKIAAEAEVISGGLAGTIDVGDGSGRWRIATEGGGQMHARHWSPALARRCSSVRLARELANQLDELVAELARSAQLDPRDQSALAEEVRLAQLALELGLRSCEGRERASLPSLTGPFAWR